MGESNILESEQIDDNQSFFEEKGDNFEEIESTKLNTSYPNEAYADLMTLFAKYKLNNAMGNAIIKFFNKHANIDKSPLPKSIEEGRKYMDNMDLPNLKFEKTYVMTYNNKEYYLHHLSIKNCIQNILSIPDIAENFALTYENLKVIINYSQL